MALTTTQKLNAKRHMGVAPVAMTQPSEYDQLFTALEDGAELEAHLVAAITACDTALAAVQLAHTDADELTEGAGAKFDYRRRIGIKQDAYAAEVANLWRVLGLTPPETTGIIGVSVV